VVAFPPAHALRPLRSSIKHCDDAAFKKRIAQLAVDW